LGNIGQRLLPWLREVGYDVVGIDKKDGPSFDLAYMQYSWYGLFKGAAACIHLAATADPKASEDDVRANNITATRHVISACRVERVPRLVFASSTHAAPARYGNPDAVGPVPYNWYGFSKAVSEEDLRFTSLDNASFVAVRIGWVPDAATAAAVLRNDSDRWTVGDARTQWLQSIRLSDEKLRFAFAVALRMPLGEFNVLETVSVK
jgi:nucleoside-diphosphate-sugar epimerase